MEWRTTSTILADLRAHDDSAWRLFVERFRGPVLAFERSLGLAPDDAEDAAQETLLAFAEAFRAGKYDPNKGRLSQWLFGIAYRQALRLRRSNARRGATIHSKEEGTTFWSGLPDETDAGGIWEREWERAVLQACMERVQSEFEPRTLEAFEAVVRDDRAPSDVARMLDVPVKVVYNAKHRILKRIRELRAQYEEAADAPAAPQ